MFRKTGIRIRILWIVLSILICGCDDAATRIAREATERQAQQNTAMAQLNKEVAVGTRRLVEADAQARQEIVAVHRDLQAERSHLNTGWNALEQQRQQMASQRRTESTLAPAIEAAAVIALAVVLLGFCWYAVVASRRCDGSDSQLNEILIGELLPTEPPVLMSGNQSPSLLGDLRQADPSDKS